MQDDPWQQRGYGWQQQRGFAQQGPPAPNYPNQQDQGPALNGGMYQQQEYYEEQQEPLTVSLVVPEGVGPGMKLQYDAPDGQELRLTVPDGVPPGSVMTLTQDPVTKQWKCMAEPAENLEGAPQQPQQQQQQYEQYEDVMEYHRQPQNHQQQNASAPCTAPAPQERAMPAQQMHQQAPKITTYPAGQAPRIVTKSTVVHPLPVNLSYVPPPAQVSTSVQMAPGQVILAGHPAAAQQRPSYTPPPISIVDRPSFTPLPQAMPAAPQPMPLAAAPATLAADPSQFNPPRQVPYVVQDGLDRRPSYTPPPQMLPQMGPPVVGQTPSYVPPPAMPVIQNSPSYVPPPAGVPMVPMVQSPSYVPPPAITTAPPVTYAAPPPDMMGTTASVAYPQMPACGVPMDPSSVQMHPAHPIGMQATMGAPSMGTMPGTVQYMAPPAPQSVGVMHAEYGMLQTHGQPLGMLPQAQVPQYGAPPQHHDFGAAAQPGGVVMQPQLAPGGVQVLPGMGMPMYQSAPAPCASVTAPQLFAPAPPGGLGAMPMAMHPQIGMPCQPQMGFQMPGLLGVGSLQASQAPQLFQAPHLLQQQQPLHLQPQPPPQ